MRRIDRATPDQAERVFDIMVRATEVGCAPFYPPEVIGIWHKGRSAEAMAGVLVESDVYSLVDDDVLRGFVHIEGSEVVGLFVHPGEQRKGYGTELLKFATDRIAERPILVLSTLNAVSFYAKHGFRKMGMDSVRRHDHDIYGVRMELV